MYDNYITILKERVSRKQQQCWNCFRAKLNPISLVGTYNII